jgi:hypothetical protein
MKLRAKSTAIFLADGGDTAHESYEMMFTKFTNLYEKEARS